MNAVGTLTIQMPNWFFIACSIYFILRVMIAISEAIYRRRRDAEMRGESYGKKEE